MYVGFFQYSVRNHFEQIVFFTYHKAVAGDRQTCTIYDSKQSKNHCIYVCILGLHCETLGDTNLRVPYHDLGVP